MKNKVKEQIARGEKVVGTFFDIGGLSEMECLGYTGLDFVVIDTEHGPYDTETVADLIRTAERVDLTPFVRIADVTHKEIQRASDVGARGLIVPCLRTMEEMRSLVNFAKFAPVGQRGFFPARSGGYGQQEWARDINDYMRGSNDGLLVLPQCETVECLANIEEVAAMDGIDGIFIGPFDLSISMGIPGEFTNKDFQAAVARILKACKAAGKISLIYTGDMASAKKYLQAGFDGVTHSLDCSVLIEAYQSIVKSLK